MAEHFEEVVNLRLQAMETRVDNELMAIEKHFKELQTFWIESLNKTADRIEARLEVRLDARIEPRFRAQTAWLQAELEARFSGLRSEFQARLGHLDVKMDAHHNATHLVLHDILRRLPSDRG